MSVTLLYKVPFTLFTNSLVLDHCEQTDFRCSQKVNISFISTLHTNLNLLRLMKQINERVKPCVRRPFYVCLQSLNESIEFGDCCGVNYSCSKSNIKKGKSWLYNIESIPIFLPPTQAFPIFISKEWGTEFDTIRRNR